MSWGPAGVFLLAILDSAGIPLVGGIDALVVLVAVLDRKEAYPAAGAAVAGSLLGCLVLFYIARKGGEAYHRRHTAGPRGARLRAWFLEYGLLTVFVPALVPFIPLPMKIFVISAGALEVNPITFTIVLLVARIPRYFFLAWLGTKLGEDTLPYLRHHLWQLGLLAVALFVVLYLLIRVIDRRHKLSKLSSNSPE